MKRCALNGNACCLSIIYVEIERYMHKNVSNTLTVVLSNLYYLTFTGRGGHPLDVFFAITPDPFVMSLLLLFFKLQIRLGYLDLRIRLRELKLGITDVLFKSDLMESDSFSGQVRSLTCDIRSKPLHDCFIINFVRTF